MGSVADGRVGGLELECELEWRSIGELTLAILFCKAKKYNSASSPRSHYDIGQLSVSASLR